MRVEEDQLAIYCVNVIDMGFGLTRSDIMENCGKVWWKRKNNCGRMVLV